MVKRLNRNSRKGEGKHVKSKTSSLIKLIIGAAVLIGLPAVIPNSYVMQLVLNIIIYVILAMGLTC